MFPDGKVLEIDLDNLTSKSTTLPGETYRLYPGGSSLAAYLILQNMEPGVEALSGENVLVFAVSPLTGFPISGTSRLVVAAKSPLTGALGDSQGGGFFPAALKANGYDAVVFRGRARQPSYVYVDGDRVEIRPAGDIWGCVTGEAEERIRKDLGEDRVEICQIGPGGEKQVRYACVLSMCSRANGRTGMGAVMGAKNLKALVVKKQKAPAASDPSAFAALARQAATRLESNDAVRGLGDIGTAGDLGAFNEIGFLATRNWQSGYSGPPAEGITGEAMKKTILKDRDTCFGCAVRCKRVVEVEGTVEPLYGGPEYETIATFGPYCGVYDLPAIARANQLCNMYGLDTISCGATIAFAMECYERGLIDREFTDGLELRFGNADAMLELTERIALRKGAFASLLAEGSRRAAEAIGPEAIPFAMTVKGAEFAAHMPQYKPGLGIVYAVNPFGCDHQSSENDPVLSMPPDSQEKIWLGKLGITQSEDEPHGLGDEKVRFAFDSQCFYSILDTLCLCQFVWGPTWQLYGPDDILELCRSAIGWETSLYELMRAGERRINLLRAFNAGEGFGATDDVLPERMFAPMADGPSQGTRIDEAAFTEAVKTYYQYAGWDPESGNPTDGTLRRLSLGWLCDREGVRCGSS